MCLETKPKKARRKIKPSAMIRPQKRSKKRKRVQSKNQEQAGNASQQVRAFTEVSEPIELNICETSSAYESSEDVGLGTLSETEFATIKEEDHPHHMGEFVVECSGFGVFDWVSFQIQSWNMFYRCRMRSLVIWS